MRVLGSVWCCYFYRNFSLWVTFSYTSSITRLVLIKPVLWGLRFVYGKKLCIEKITLVHETANNEIKELKQNDEYLLFYSIFDIFVCYQW